MVVLNGYCQKKKTVTGEIIAKYTIEVGGENDEDRLDSVMLLLEDHREEIIGELLEKMAYSIEFTEPRVLQPFRKSKRAKRRKNEGDKD